MGTNYYFTRDVCPHCGRGSEELHIGKSSVGWCFSLRIYPSEGVNTLLDWGLLFRQPNSIIRDEYGEQVSRDQMLAIITDRSAPMPITEESVRNGPFSYPSLVAFLQDNYAELGPNNLLRHRVEFRGGTKCVRQGEGTWDYFVGDFS